MTLTVGSLCSGAGQLDAAVAHVLGAEHAWFAEVDPAASKVLAHRFPGVPNHDDITKVDWAAIEPVDVLCAGFPCQDVSAAGKRAGLRPGTRSGLWRWVAHVIAAKRPPLVVLENVRGLLNAEAHSDMEPCPWCVGDDPERVVLRALGAVLGDLADIGYDATWYGLRASDVGAAHPRFRVFVVATPTDAEGNRHGYPWSTGGEGLPSAAAGGAVRPDGLSLLPTPTAADAERRSATYARGNPTLVGALLPTPAAARSGRQQSPSPGAAIRPSLDQITHLLPTPAARLGGRWGAPNAETAARRMYDEGRRNLEDAIALLPAGPPLAPSVALLPTPRATDGAKGGPNQRGSSGDLMLPSAVMLLPTPTVADSRGSRNATAGRSDDASSEWSPGWSLSDIAYADRWGEYAPAIARWERVIGRPAPSPIEPGGCGMARVREFAHKNGVDGYTALEMLRTGRWGGRLSAQFAEWLMGWPDGWVTQVPDLTRNDALRIIGNGVVPQQAAYAVAVLLHLHSLEVAA